jgi:hypothetical protein
VWGMCSIARRFFFRDADIVSQLLLAGIVANVFAYIPSTFANSTALNTREIAPVLPFAAVLAGRMLGDRLLTGPLATIRLPGRQFGVRLVAGSLVALLGWYSYGLWRQADTPAAPQPYAQLAAFLERNHLHYGLGGYWQASVITVETGGAVTIRAITSACLQPRLWESKSEWYDPATGNRANFLLLSNVSGYFNKFAVAPGPLLLLNSWYGNPKYVQTGRYNIVNGNKQYSYVARVYPVNLLDLTQKLSNNLTAPPPWLLRTLKSKGQKLAACG